MGRKTVEVKIVDASEAVQTALMERDENTCRKPFTPSEMAAMALKLEARVKKANKQKQIAAGGDHTQRGSGSAQLSGTAASTCTKGDTRDLVAQVVGASRANLSRAISVVRNGTRELVAAMDSGKVAVSTASRIAALPKQPRQTKRAGAIRSALTAH